jgi:hypothetical protein
MNKKSSAASPVTVRDGKTGRYLTVKGAKSMAGSVLSIKKGVDLSKPIARQVLNERRDKKG